MPPEIQILKGLYYVILTLIKLKYVDIFLFFCWFTWIHFICGNFMGNSMDNFMVNFVSNFMSNLLTISWSILMTVLGQFYGQFCGKFKGQFRKQFCGQFLYKLVDNFNYFFFLFFPFFPFSNSLIIWTMAFWANRRHNTFS